MVALYGDKQGHGRTQAWPPPGQDQLGPSSLGGSLSFDRASLNSRTASIASSVFFCEATFVSPPRRQNTVTTIKRTALSCSVGRARFVDVDIDLTGFSTGEIDMILTPAGDPDDEVIPPVPGTARTKPGDIWMLGEHRVGCGDGRDAKFLQRVIGDGARVDAAFLDPPYNVPIGGHAVSAGSHREFAMASGEMSEAEFRSFLTDTLGAAARCSRDGAVHFVCMDWRHIDSVSAVGTTVYGEHLNLCIWNKSNAGMGSLYRSKHELIFVYRVGTAPHLNMVELGRHGRNRTNVWDYASVNSMRGSRREDLALHPTVKPTGLVADAIQDLDLFLGSGTTLLAAERTGRRFRGLDIDPGYVDVAIERWSARTGLEPRLEEPAS
jgi:DNA modification methylase